MQANGLEIWWDQTLPSGEAWRENIQSALESLVEKLEAMKLHLSDRELEREFKQAQRLRDKLRELQ